MEGVLEVTSGYTDHYEAVKVVYDPDKVAYEKLLERFWQQIDPTDPNGQFADVGPQYRTAIFYADDAQKRAAEKSRDELDRSGKFEEPIVTEILPVGEFYPAEDYHQEYYRKNPTHYKLYKAGSGREGYIKKTWGKD